MNPRLHTTMSVNADNPLATGEKKYVFRGDGVPVGKVVQVAPHRSSDRVMIVVIEKAREAGGPPIERPYEGSLPVRFPWDKT